MYIRTQKVKVKVKVEKKEGKESMRSTVIARTAKNTHLTRYYN